MMALVLRTLIERCKCWQTGVIEGTKGIWKECGHLTNFQISPRLMWLTIKYYISILSKQHAKTYTLYPQRSINAFSISASKVCEFAEPFKCYCGTLSSKQQNIVLSNLQMATLILCSSIPLTSYILYATIFLKFPMANNGARVHLKTATWLEEKEQHQYIHHEPA